MTRDATGVVLAGGRARRFGGRDKGALLVDGRRIIDRLLDALHALTPHVIIVANEPGRYADLAVPVVPDVVAGQGPLGGLYSALVSITTPRALVVACDLPFVTAPFLAHVADAGRDVDVALPRTRDGLHPLCASWATHTATHLRRCLAEQRLGVIAALDGLRVREIGPEDVAAFDLDGRLLVNLNTEHDYRVHIARSHHDR